MAKQYDENYFVAEEKEMKSNIEDLLTEDEQLLWRGKPKKSAFIWSKIVKMLPIAIIWLLFDGGFITMMLVNGVFASMPIGELIGIGAFFLFHLLPVWIWLGNIITANRELKNLEYAFTNTRIIIRRGIVGINVDSIYYTKIRGVNLKVGFIDKMLKVGDIYISGAFKSEVLWDIENPYVMVTKLQQIIHDVQTDVEYPNALRPDSNPGYKTRYDR